MTTSRAFLFVVCTVASLGRAIAAAPDPEPALPSSALAPEPALPASDTPAPAPVPAPAPADAQPASNSASTPAFDAWMTQPASAPVPPRENVANYLGSLQQRQVDLDKTLDFLVSRKRLRKDEAAKETATIVVPQDLSMERWDQIAQTHQDQKLSDNDYAAALLAFADKFRTLDSAQQTLSHKCAQLMLHPDATPIPIRRAHPVNPVNRVPAATPAATPPPKR